MGFKHKGSRDNKLLLNVSPIGVLGILRGLLSIISKPLKMPTTLLWETLGSNSLPQQRLCPKTILIVRKHNESLNIN